MKKILFLAAISASLFACTKNSDTNDAPSNISYLKSAITNHNNGDDSTAVTFGYDVSNNLVSVSNYNNSYKYSQIDSGSYFFTFSGNNNLPTSYINVSRKYFYTETSIITYNLFYDNKNRIIKDTVISRIGKGYQPPPVVYYSYSNSGDTIAVNTMNYVGSVLTTGYFDTIFLKNGNVSKFVSYLNQSNMKFLNYSWSVNNYSTYANPYYIPKVASSLGAFFVEHNFEFLSKNTPEANSTFTIATDSKGRVSQTNDMIGHFKTTFTYK